MRCHRFVTVLSLTAFLALGACADEPDADVEGGVPTGEIEPEAPAADMEAERGFSQWDSDQDTYLVREEWDAWWADNDISGDFDTDGTDGLGQEEWANTTYSFWDADDDDRITEEEWTQGTERWFGADAEYGAWADWDLDGDSELDANEVAEGFEREGLYDRVDRDADAVIDDEELADWFFDVFDFDDDDRIDTTEWDWGESDATFRR